MKPLAAATKPDKHL